MSDTTQILLSELRGHIRILTINRPERSNSISPELGDALIEAFVEANADPEVRVVVLTAVGDRAFCGGADLKARAEEDRAGKPFQPLLSRVQRYLYEVVYETFKPTIAALNGGVYGGSTDLALACDFRIGVEATRMFMPAARLGIVYYQSGLRRYVSRLGLNNAKRLFLTAAPVEADELLAMGYLSEIVSADQLMTRVDALASEVAANAPLALAATKKALNDVAAGRLDPAWHDAARIACAKSEDHQEGLRAWAEKRKPVFQGR